MRLLLDNVRIVEPGVRITHGAVALADGKIEHVGSVPKEFKADERLDGGGKLLTPGMVDLHTHGMHKFMYYEPEPLFGAADVLGAYGTTCILPTIIPNPAPDLMQKLDRFTSEMTKVTKVAIPGLHLEGPFVTQGGAACATLPGDMGLLKELLAACHGRVSAMSIAPDQSDILPVIEHLVEHKIAPFITHTRASPQQTQAAIDAGARHATHFYNVFPLPPEKEPGLRPVGAVETIFANRHVTCDFIADGVHIEPVVIRATLAAKGFEGIVLITDSNIGAGLPPGIFDTPWGYKVRVHPQNAARHIEKNFLCGSSLTMNLGMANLLKWLELPPEQTWAMGTSNPARVVGLTNKGVMRAGADADVVLWNDDLTANRTWVAGQCVYGA